ncbi:unnamed protein product, partial [Iphiclides podalirius]
MLKAVGTVQSPNYSNRRQQCSKALRFPLSNEKPVEIGQEDIPYQPLLSVLVAFAAKNRGQAHMELGNDRKHERQIFPVHIPRESRYKREPTMTGIIRAALRPQELKPV